MTRVIACALFAAAAALLVMVWKAPIVQLNSAVATHLNRWQFPSLLLRQREIQRLQLLYI